MHAFRDRSSVLKDDCFSFISIILTFLVMLSVGASCFTLLQQPTNTASDAVTTMLGLAGTGKKAGASDRRSSSRCDFGAGRASSWPRWTCEEAAAAAAAAFGVAASGLAAAVVAAIVKDEAKEEEQRREKSSLLSKREEAKGK